MNAYERTLQDDMAGLTEDQQLAALKVITANDISRESVENWFRETELWYEGQRGFRGPVQRVFDDGEENKFDDDIEYLYATVFGKQRVDFLRTTQVQWANRVAGIVETVLTVIEKPEQVQAAYRSDFYQLGGGLPWADMDADMLAEAKAEYETEQREAEEARLAAERELEAQQTLERNVADWRTRFDAALNTLRTSEQAKGLADVRLIVSEMESD